MVEKSVFEQPEFIDNGTVNWIPVTAAFSEIQDILNEHADELKGLARHNTQSISYAIEGAGTTPVLKPGRHTRSRLVNAYVLMGDSIAEEATVVLQGITNTIKFSATEKAGKVRIFTILKDSLHFIDMVKAETTGNRRIVVTLTLESTEEQ